MRVNLTRRSASIPRRLIRERKFHLLPLYAILRASDLAREGMERSGSFRFADHIYAGRPSGAFVVGALLDRVLLSLPSARSFRNRFLHVKASAMAFLESRTGPIDVLSVPSGIPRDLIDVAGELRSRDAARLGEIRFLLLDIDPEALQIAGRLASASGLGFAFSTIEADALQRESFPARADFIASTGFTEFLDDAEVVRFYEHCRETLAPGGLFVTSSTIRHPLSAWMMEELAELHAHYRDEKATLALLRAAGFEARSVDRDPVGYQVLVSCSK